MLIGKPPTDNEANHRPARKGARCPSCGCRVGPEGCPEHGRPPETNAIPDLAPESELELPHFKGYRTERILGRGGFGTVYAARITSSSSPNSGRRVAIKLARNDKPGAARRLAHELAALRMVGPPSVPEVLDAGQIAEGRPYIVMELVEARTLAEILSSRAKPLEPEEACAFAQALLGALEAVHAEGLVHRDLKPENVLLREPKGSATVLDLGLARRAGLVVAPLAFEQASDGAMIGTPEYMAPEQCEGRANIDARADVYAVGIMLYEMLAGHPPFWGPLAAVREGHLSRRPTRLVGSSETAAPIPEALEEVILRCLEKDPAARYASASLLREAIAAVKIDRAPAETSPVASTRSLPRATEPGTSERRTVSLLHFSSPLDSIALRTRIEAIGGHVMRASGDRYVVAFGHKADENPARLSLRAAQELINRKICKSVWVDLANVLVTIRPDGSERLVSAHLARAVQTPLPEGSKILLSPAAHAVLTDADLSAAAPLLGSEVVAEPNLPGKDDPTSPFGFVTPPLVGRGDLLETLEQLAFDAAHGKPSVAVIVGEAGHGKSHLRRLLVERVRARESTGPADTSRKSWTFVDLRAREPVVGGGDSVRNLLSEALGLAGTAADEASRKAALSNRLGPAATPEAEAALALALGWIDPQKADPGLRALEAAPFALGAALRVAGGEALRRRAAEKAPLFIVLDDAHFADEASLAVLEHATLAEARAPIFVCALSRPVFRENHPSWGERAERHEHFELGALDAVSAAQLCHLLLHPAANVPESAVRRLVERTQGIPLLLVELVRGLKAAGIVRRHPAGRGFYVATDELDRLPDLPLIEWLAHREIDALSPAERAHARLVATVGAEVTTEEVSGILRGILRRLDQSGEASEFPLDARIGIDRLLAAGVLRRQRQGRVAFRHALVREAIARGVPEALRRKIHLTAAEYYRDALGAPDGPPEEVRLPQLAFHAARAGLAEVAESAYLALAESARARHAYVDAERFYTLALEQPSEACKHRREAHRGRGLMRYRVGRYHDALEDFSEAQKAAEAAGDKLEVAAILLDEATALDWMGDHVSSRKKVLEAQAVAEDRATPLLSARLHLGIGRSHYRLSFGEEAVVALEKAATAAAALGEEGYETQVIALLMLGFLEQSMGRLDDAEGTLERAISLCESHGDVLHLAASISNRGVLRALRGDRVSMVADFKRVISLGIELGQEFLELLGNQNLGEFFYWMDDLESAVPHVDAAGKVDERRAPGASRPEIVLLDARVKLYQGNIERAKSLVAGLRRGAGERLAVPSDDVLCSMIELATGDDADDAAWDALEARSEKTSIGQERIEVIEARGLWALHQGRAREARQILERAMELASRIPNVMGERLARRLAEARRAEAGEAPAPDDGRS